MSFYLEIHCDVLSDGPDDYVAIQPYCFSQRSNSPQILAMSRQKALIAALRALEARAKEHGWAKTRKHGWVCPNCQKVRHD